MHLNERKFLFIFPGQGSQYRGIGSDIYAEFAGARSIFDKASNVLGCDLTEICFNDTEHVLDRTKLTQPAVLTHSIACLEVFKDLTDGQIEPSITAGHSLGEYSALVAAGALTFEDALRLVVRRAEAMASQGRGRMVAVRLGAKAIRTMVERLYCGIGGCNLPNQTVVGGAEPDLLRFCEMVQATHDTVPAPLNAEGAFHTYLMIGAAEMFRPSLDAAPLKSPRCRVLSNYSGDYHESDPATIKAHLFFQIFNPVKWVWSIETALASPLDVVVELGGGVGKASGPDGKRPNLESITRTLLRKHGSDAVYLPAINARHLKRGARFLRLLEHTRSNADVTVPGQAAVTGSHQQYRLYLVTRDGLPTGSAIGLMHRIDELDLGDVVALVGESLEQNIESLGYLAPTGAGSPQPYLEWIVESESAAVLHFFGDEIEQELRSLSSRVQHSRDRSAPVAAVSH